MTEITEKKKYASPVTEAITLQLENGIMGTSDSNSINGVSATTAYDEIIIW